MVVSFSFFNLSNLLIFYYDENSYFENRRIKMIKSKKRSRNVRLDIEMLFKFRSRLVWNGRRIHLSSFIDRISIRTIFTKKEMFFEIFDHIYCFLNEFFVYSYTKYLCFYLFLISIIK